MCRRHRYSSGHVALLSWYDSVVGVIGSDDSFNLARFVEAQDRGGTYDRALREIRGGRKVSHWMWFVFPQIAGLGSSPMAQRYAIESLDEAAAYLRHPVLGPRLIECAMALLDLDGEADAEHVLGSIDAIKLRSSMTLFQQVDPEQPVFGEVLNRYFGGTPDPATLARVRRDSNSRVGPEPRST
jgi:uncharacterized protein (DUF1810 family)